MLFPKFHYNDLLPTYCGLVGKSACQQVRNMSTASPSAGSYGETCVMDFGHCPVPGAREPRGQGGRLPTQL